MVPAQQMLVILSLSKDLGTAAKEIIQRLFYIQFLRNEE